MFVGNKVLYRLVFEHNAQYKQKSLTVDVFNKHLFVSCECVLYVINTVQLFVLSVAQKCYVFDYLCFSIIV